MEVDAFLREVRLAPWHEGQIADIRELPPRSSVAGTLQHSLHPALEQALEEQGLLPLYAHQARAADTVLDGQDVVVVTPAASGKSLCHNIPVVQAFLEDPSSRALYLFPTKALAQDQRRGLRDLLPPTLRSRAAIFDGDTPHHERAALRRTARVVLSNPDMLHLGMLPRHRSWARLLAGLQYVVIDEAHVYRGVFGSHVANVLRRLRRLCRRYGSDPRFILCSATIANPGEFAMRLTGRPATAVDDDGSPYGGKRFVFWNPPLIDEEEGVRRSARGETAHLLDLLVRGSVRTLAFVRTRRQAELVYMAVRERLRDGAAGLVERVRPYRASYLAEDRRLVEQGLLHGDLLAVVATNALELGIDIGDLDATILNGYPGSISSAWQQAGRSGRSGNESLSVLVGQGNPLDQYLMRHPDFFFGRPHEHARILPENPYVLSPHLRCAAYEVPLSEEDAALFGETFADQVQGLEHDGVLHRRYDRWHLDPSVSYPAHEVSIRSAWGSQYLAAESESGRVLERVEEFAAFSQLHPGAVYLHQGESYLVQQLDLATKTAYLSLTDAPYYTESRDVTDIRVLETMRSKELGGVTVCLGEVEVSRTVVGYRRKTLGSDEVLGDELLDLPVRPFRTMALWFGLPPAALKWALGERRDLAGGLHAIEHATIGVLPLFALCDRNDIGGVSTAIHPDTGSPQVFIYDGHPGGIGIAEHGYEVVEELWKVTLQTVDGCPCAEGCPGCIQSPKCGNNNSPLDKEVAIRFLRDISGWARH